jgi:hypothetical protein
MGALLVVSEGYATTVQLLGNARATGKVRFGETPLAKCINWAGT